MRLQTVRAGRQCIRPEVCRTYNFGAVGSSAGQHFNMYLRPVRLNNVTVPWAATVRRQDDLTERRHDSLLHLLTSYRRLGSYLRAVPRCWAVACMCTLAEA